MLGYLGLNFPCAQGVTKSLAPGQGGYEAAPASQIANLKPLPKQIDLATVDTIDTLPDLNDTDVDNTWGSSLDGDSDSEESDVKDDIKLRVADTVDVREWCESDYELVKTLQLAPRNQGRVDLMKSIEGGNFVAVKRMPNSWMKSSQKEFDSAYPESAERPWFDIGIINFLHESGFDHVCKPWGVFSDGLDTYVVSSYASEGELFSWLERDPAPGPEREAEVRPIMKQLFSAVKWLHNRGIAHNDISLENVLITDEGSGPVVKLIDFGMASLDRMSDNPCGKKSYMAPEMYMNAPFDVFSADAFALGVVLFSVCCREYPWNSTKPGSCKLFAYVQKHGFQNFVERKKVWNGADPQQRLAQAMSKPLLALLAGLLQMNPEERMTIGETTAEKKQGSSIWSTSNWLNVAQA